MTQWRSKLGCTREFAFGRRKMAWNVDLKCPSFDSCKQNDHCFFVEHVFLFLLLMMVYTPTKWRLHLSLAVVNSWRSPMWNFTLNKTLVFELTFREMICSLHTHINFLQTSSLIFCSAKWCFKKRDVLRTHKYGSQIEFWICWFKIKCCWEGRKWYIWLPFLPSRTFLTRGFKKNPCWIYVGQGEPCILFKRSTGGSNMREKVRGVRGKTDDLN